MPSGKCRARQCGFAYVLLLLALAIVSLVAATSLALGATMARRSAEQELLAIGREYENAMTRYQMATPAGVLVRAPKSLAELLRDPRYPMPKRYLRKAYADPMTGEDAWGAVRAPDGTIICVYSLSKGAPIQQAGFTDRWVGFNKAKSYADWCFGH
jgi:type II secretory pathway pseudopilin PulG